MANKLLHLMLSRLDKGLRAKTVTTMAQAWDAAGRPDLREIADARELLMAPVLSSFLYEAKRRLAARLVEVEVDNGSGGKVTVMRRAEPLAAKERPLTHFLHTGRDGRTRYYQLRETKGWLRGIVDDYEVRAYKKQGVTERHDGLPMTRAFDRWRVAA